MSPSMLVNNWPNAVAHVDADCFYASCERLRHPELRAIPVCVLSSQDACVVAKTYDAKAAGITTGMPVWEAKRKLPEAIYIPADFAYYGQISDQLFAVLGRFSPELETYSIDEGFLGLNGLRALWRKSWSEIADTIRAEIRNEVGITVSVGVSVTKTLAKIASEYNKPDGTTVVAGRKIGDFLEWVKVRDIPGIGANRQALLHKFGMTTAAQFVDAPEPFIHRLLGKLGTDLRHELRGVPVYPLDLLPALPKSIARTASMGEISGDKSMLAAHLTHHTTRLATELITRRYVAARISLFLTLQSFDKVDAEIRFDQATANYFAISPMVQAMLNRLFQPGQRYRACGVIATEIAPAASVMPDLFGRVEQDERQGRLLETMDRINRKYGKGTLRMCAASGLRASSRSERFQLPLFDLE
ncbi:MAG: DUF4113 domain-containing protein [Sulfuricellaceae bacterium]|nr:DUF4113 domain-containing protein [Sulfuricellaceae bacterium]